MSGPTSVRSVTSRFTIKIGKIIGPCLLGMIPFAVIFSFMGATGVW